MYLPPTPPPPVASMDDALAQALDELLTLSGGSLEKGKFYKAASTPTKLTSLKQWIP